MDRGCPAVVRMSHPHHLVITKKWETGIIYRSPSLFDAVKNGLQGVPERAMAISAPRQQSNIDYTE